MVVKITKINLDYQFSVGVEVEKELPAD